jgi:SseB protein N-terminal domain
VSRAIPDPGFGGDDGSADPRLADALDGYAAGRVPESELLAVLGTARLLVPVVAVLAEAEALDQPGALRREKRTDMALVTLRTPDGSKALPAFTSLATLAGWNADARPVPVGARRACQAALAEGADTVLVDLGAPVSYPLTGPALRALAAGRLPVPPLEDPEVREAVHAAVRAEPGLAQVRLLPGRDSDLTIGLVLAAGTTAEHAREAAQRVAARLAENPVVRDRVGRGVELAVLPPDPP